MFGFLDHWHLDNGEVLMQKALPVQHWMELHCPPLTGVWCGWGWESPPPKLTLRPPLFLVHTPEGGRLLTGSHSPQNGIVSLLSFQGSNQDEQGDEGDH